eukprot:4456411-Amphidinium_carterae.1
MSSKQRVERKTDNDDYEHRCLWNESRVERHVMFCCACCGGSVISHGRLIRNRFVVVLGTHSLQIPLSFILSLSVVLTPQQYHLDDLVYRCSRSKIAKEGTQEL